jgi:hypothetical protein
MSLLLMPAYSGETVVHRCTKADGSIELSQFACPNAADWQEITVDDREVGWTPPGSAGRARPPTTSGKRSRSASPQRQGAAKVADRCWKKQRQLDDVNWKLRHGYRPSEGTKLRRRRESYEAYIDRYCRDGAAAGR